MVGKYAEVESGSERASRRCSEPTAAVAADPRGLRALPTGSPGDAGLAQDAGLLRRHGPALPALGGGRRAGEIRGIGRVSAARLSRPAGDEARAAAWPALAAEDHPGVAPGDSLLPALREPRGLPHRRPHPRAHFATSARQRADGLSHRPGAEGARRLQPRGADRGPGGPDSRRLRIAESRDLRAGTPGSRWSLRCDD